MPLHHKQSRVRFDDADADVPIETAEELPSSSEEDTLHQTLPFDTYVSPLDTYLRGPYVAPISDNGEDSTEGRPRLRPSSQRLTESSMSVLRLPVEPQRVHYGIIDNEVTRGRQAARLSQDTLIGDEKENAKLEQDIYKKLSPSAPDSSPDRYTMTPRPLRSALRRSNSDVTRPAISRMSTNALEANAKRPKKGVFASLFRIYAHHGSDKHDTSPAASRPLSRANSFASSFPRIKRRSSVAFDDTPLDNDDPAITGAKPNRLDDEKHAHEAVIESLRRPGFHRTASRKKKAAIEYHVSSILHRQNFILKLAKALMTFGAPSHRIESQLMATAKVLELDAQFVHLPDVIIASFGDQDTRTSDTHFVKAHGSLTLGSLHKVHNIYRKVVHDQMGVEEGTNELRDLLNAPPIFSLTLRCIIAFLCAALICPLAFGGSFLDMCVSGFCGAVLAYLQLHAANKNAMYANVFEISIAILMSFVARALGSLSVRLFCYQAISSAAVVLILPGYLILCSSLELASKNIVCGSVRMIYAIIYSLFLGFGLTIGSDLYFLVDSAARHRQDIATRALEDMVILHGTFISDNQTFSPFSGTFSFSNTSDTAMNSIDGCYRPPDGPWYTAEFPDWSLFVLVPLFSIFSSFWNLQPAKSKQLFVMVFISCAAFTANKFANNYIFNRSDVVSAIGAFVVGILGNLYSRLFRGTAFQSMVTGVLFLVPSGIAAAGGLAQNYRGQDGDEYSNGLSIGLRMVQVAIGITVGLFGSGLIVYSFGSRKNAALFAF